MNNIHNIACPGCDSPDHIENTINGEIWYYWKCSVCNTRIRTDALTGALSSYSVYATYIDVLYEGYINVADNTFGLVKHTFNGFRNILVLPFAPDFNANNFAKKLPTLLTFH